MRTSTRFENPAKFIRSQLPEEGLFAGHEWRIAPTPFPLDRRLAKELEKLGRVLLQFYRATNLLYRKSADGKLPGWIAQLLDQGKPDDLVQLQRHEAFKHDVPRVIRPDILLTEEGFSITELDSVPGGIGLTAWLNQTYHRAGEQNASDNAATSASPVIGGADGPLRGFAAIFEGAARGRIVVSEEAATYRPEMRWITEQINSSNLTDAPLEVCGDQSQDFSSGDRVYRFFELFDLPNVPVADRIFDLATTEEITLSPPPKAFLEEKLLFSLLWNRNLHEFWRQELGQGFLRSLQQHVPYSWTLDPAPLPPHAAYPELGLTDWHQLKTLSQKERRLILKISGFAPEAWGARGVYLGSDLSTEEWSNVVDQALRNFSKHPQILQRFTKPKTVETSYYDFSADKIVPMTGRVRLCPYYFVHGTGDQARAKLGGCLATICPADKKIIHGMSDAIMAPCCVGQ